MTTTYMEISYSRFLHFKNSNSANFFMTKETEKEKKQKQELHVCIIIFDTIHTPQASPPDKALSIDTRPLFSVRITKLLILLSLVTRHRCWETPRKWKVWNCLRCTRKALRIHIRFESVTQKAVDQGMSLMCH